MLQIIGAGFGRTGTLSLKSALEMLGFEPCYHMEDVVKRPWHIGYWQAIVNGHAPMWDRIFAGYQATVDWPAANFVPELMAKYPDAKVILTVRDPERWYDSATNTIFAVNQVSWPARTLLLPAALFLRMTNGLIWKGTFNGRFPERDYAISIFNQHIETIKQIVPTEKLLVFEVKEGWEPLCDFLGVPVPDEPFPHVNDRQVMVNRVKMLEWTGWATVAGLILGVGVLGVKLLRR